MYLKYRYCLNHTIAQLKFNVEPFTNGHFENSLGWIKSDEVLVNDLNNFLLIDEFGSCVTYFNYSTI